MCGVFAFLDIVSNPTARREEAVRQTGMLRHRGPDWSGVWSSERAVLAHERLAIVDVLHGSQPLESADGSLVLAVNGEIYNHRELRAALPAWEFRTESDCEVILGLWSQKGTKLFSDLRGMYAFVLVEAKTGRWVIGRDPVGIIPLYCGRTADGTLVVASEMKALLGVCTTVREFPPGHYQTSDDAAPVRFWSPDWFELAGVSQEGSFDATVLREALTDSVRAHLMSDVPYGVLLSGGLDSSVVSAIAARFADSRVESDGKERAWWPGLHTFSIGLEGSPDAAAAKKVAEFLGTTHHGFTFTVQEGLDAIRDVIWHLETFDVTTIRASTPMYLMARRIRAMGVKMVLSGEGADEIFGGYLYFHKAPDPAAFYEETVRKIRALHLYDCARANKSMAAFGVEARVPFLDGRFLDMAMRIPVRRKMCGGGKIEKHVLREAFEGWLPPEILWRQKEQFSDGVGYGWIDTLKAKAAAQISDRQLAEAKERFPVGAPGTKEAYVYRTIFDELFPLPSAAACVPWGPSVACSTPAALAWDEAFRRNADPSGRSVAVHASSVAGAATAPTAGGK